MPTKIQTALRSHSSASELYNTQDQFSSIKFPTNPATANEKKNVLEYYAKGKIDRDAYGKKCRQYDTEIRKVRSKRDELLEKVPTFHKNDTLEIGVERYCDFVKKRLRKCGDFDSKRQLLLDYIRKIIFTKGKVELHGSVPTLPEVYSESEQTSETKGLKFIVKKEIH